MLRQLRPFQAKDYVLIGFGKFPPKIQCLVKPIENLVIDAVLYLWGNIRIASFAEAPPGIRDLIFWRLDVTNNVEVIKKLKKDVMGS